MATWPGDGGYVYAVTIGDAADGAGHLLAFAYDVDAAGAPRLALAGASSDRLEYGSGSPVVTSNGTTSGSAIVWSTWCLTGGCGDSELRAYAAVPAGGELPLLWRSPIGVANKFTPPGVDGDRIYVVTRDGHLVGYGPAAPVGGDDLSFGATIIGEQRTLPAVLAASDDVTITGVATDDAQFRIDAGGTSFPLALRKGETVTFPVTYKPTARGAVSQALTISTTAGERALILAGQGDKVELAASVPQLDLGSVEPDALAVASVSFVNSGDVPLTVASVDAPSGPFTAQGLPRVGQVINPGMTATAMVRFRATAPGDYTSALRVRTDHATSSVSLKALVPTPAVTVQDASFPRPSSAAQRRAT
jgi:hypothetical protein